MPHGYLGSRRSIVGGRVVGDYSDTMSGHDRVITHGRIPQL